MISPFLQQHIQQVLTDATGLQVTNCRLTTIGGGSINETYRVYTNKHTFFCKMNAATVYPSLFKCEREGLNLLAAQGVIRIPQVIALSETEGKQILLLEWIEEGAKTDSFWKLFGKQLAALHGIKSHSFGLLADNYMGSLPQYNNPADNWCNFFINQRLAPQVQIALNRGILEPQHARQLERVYQQLPGIFPLGQPCLVHGDLWNGNFLCDVDGKPVLIDPAVYYGHSSVDLGMTTLFGGFDELFYDSYRYYNPLPPNYGEQWELCNLYPLLVHLNLFGKNYLRDILNTIRRY